MGVKYEQYLGDDEQQSAFPLSVALADCDDDLPDNPTVRAWREIKPAIMPTFGGTDPCFSSFVSLVGPIPQDGAKVERIDVAKPYWLNNLRWSDATPKPKPGEMLKYKDVCKLTGLSKSAVYDLFRKGELSGFRSGRAVLFYRKGVEKFVKLNENKGSATPPPTPSTRTRKRASVPQMQFKFL